LSCLPSVKPQWSLVSSDRKTAKRGTMLRSPPLAQEDWHRADETTSGMSARDQDAGSDLRFGSRPIDSSIYYPEPIKDRIARDRPSIGRRVFRFVTKFSIAVLIGVGATLGWQSYGEVVGPLLVARAPALAWLLSAPTSKSPTAAATSTEPMQQLAPLASNLDVLRRSVDQLAAKQDQVTQSIAALQAVEEDIRQKISFTLTSSAPAPQVIAVPRQRPAQPRAQSPAVQSSSVPRPIPAGPVLPSR
jgi:hypothetical protein